MFDQFICEMREILLHWAELEETWTLIKTCILVKNKKQMENKVLRNGVKVNYKIDGT